MSELGALRALKGSIQETDAMQRSVLAALESLGEGVMIVDASTVLPIYMNDALRDITGYTLEEFRTMPGGLFSTLEPEQAAEVQDRLARRLAGEDVPSHYEMQIPRKDGALIQIEAAVQLVPGEPDLIFSIVRDVTARKRMQEHMQRSARLNATGRLAAGTAHDFNNLLTSILGEADLLLDSLQKYPATLEWGEIHQGIEDIRETAELGARFSKRLLELGRPRGLTTTAVDVTEVIEKMEPVLVRAISDGVCLETHLCEEECFARVFPDELEQVVLNLVLNASDALPEGGTIKIETSLVGPGGLISLAISDDGTGIVPAVKANMFEPFFTTKGSGRGTGLGLSVVDAIITRAKGTIAVDTSPGRGTTVTVMFPSVGSGDNTTTVP